MKVWINEEVKEWLPYFQRWWLALTIAFVYMHNHFNTPKESKHLSFSFYAPRLFTANWRLKYYFLFLGEKKSVSVQRLESAGWASPSNDKMILPYLTPHYLLNGIPNHVICITHWSLLQKIICTKLWGVKRKERCNEDAERKMRRNEKGRTALGYHQDNEEQWMSFG